MSDCKTCEYLDRFNCCCSNEPIMTCKAEMEEHDKMVRADVIEEFIEKFDDYRSSSDRDIYAMEMVREVAEQLKEKK